MEIRRYRQGDEGEISQLIRRTLLEINTDSPQWEIDWLYALYTPEKVAEMAGTAHTYVMTDNGIIAGTGTAAQAEGDKTEIKAAFLLPEYVGRGLGNLLFDALEADEYCRNTKHIWLTASDQALGFYERRGYTYVCGWRKRNSDKLLEMEKRL